MRIQKSQFFSNHDDFFLFHLLFGCKLDTISNCPTPAVQGELCQNARTHAHAHTHNDALSYIFHN
jgi:hypothetical protein